MVLTSGLWWIVAARDGARHGGERGGRMGSRFRVRGAGSLSWQRGDGCWEVRMREKNKQYSQNILLNITFL